MCLDSLTVSVLNLKHGDHCSVASYLCSVYSVVMANRTWQDPAGSEVPGDGCYHGRAVSMVTAAAGHIQEECWIKLA